MQTTPIRTFLSSTWKNLKPRTGLDWILIVILVVATALRFYNIPANAMFQGDQGRDAIVVANIFKTHDPVFIGPVTSVGNMYLGPLYYYFMLPWLWLSYPSPLGPVYAMAALGVLTVYLIASLGRSMVGSRPALLAAGLYAVAALPIQTARFSWNPNPAPLISIIMIYATWRAWRQDQRWWLLVAVCFAILIQLHYITLLSAGGAGLIWLFQLGSAWPFFQKKKNKSLSWLAKSKAWWLSSRKLIFISLLAAGMVVLSLTPLVLFDYKHNWVNTRGLTSMFTTEQSFKVAESQPPTVKIARIVKETHGRSLHILFEHVLGKHRRLNTLLVVVVSGWLLTRLFHRKSQTDPHWSGLVVLASYLATGIVGTAIYEHTIFDHYILYLLPITYLLFGSILDDLSHQPWGKPLTALCIAGFLWSNVLRWPLQPLSWTITDVKQVAQTITTLLEPGESYNIVLLAESKDLYGQNYRYYLSTTDHPPLTPEASPEAEALVIIDEQHHGLAATTLPIYEIQIFPEKTPSVVYTIPGGPDIIILRK